MTAAGTVEPRTIEGPQRHRRRLRWPEHVGGTRAVIYPGSALYLTWPMPLHIRSQMHRQGGDAFGAGEPSVGRGPGSDDARRVHLADRPHGCPDLARLGHPRLSLGLREEGSRRGGGFQLWLQARRRIADQRRRPAFLRRPSPLVWPHPLLGAGVVTLKLGKASAVASRQVRARPGPRRLDSVVVPG